MANLDKEQIEEITKIIRHEVQLAVQPIRDDLIKYEKRSAKKMQKFHDFMIVQVDRQKRGLMVDKSWQGIIKQVIVALVAALGILGVVIQGLSKASGG